MDIAKCTRIQNKITYPKYTLSAVRYTFKTLRLYVMRYGEAKLFFFAVYFVALAL